MKQLIIILLIVITVASCKQTQQITDAITNPSAKEIFERTLKNDSVLQDYKNKYLNVKNNRLFLETPTIIQSKTDTSQLKFLAYKLDLQQGELLKLDSDIQADSLQLIIDVYKYVNDSIISKKTYCFKYNRIQ